MAKLTAQERAALKPSQFGLPDKARTTKAHKQSGNYPIPDRGRARQRAAAQTSASKRAATTDRRRPQARSRNPARWLHARRNEAGRSASYVGSKTVSRPLLSRPRTTLDRFRPIPIGVGSGVALAQVLAPDTSQSASIRARVASSTAYSASSIAPYA